MVLVLAVVVAAVAAAIVVVGGTVRKKQLGKREELAWQGCGPRQGRIRWRSWWSKDWECWQRKQWREQAS